MRRTTPITSTDKIMNPNNYSKGTTIVAATTTYNHQQEEEEKKP